MSDTATDPSSIGRDEIGRRDFLYLATGAVAGIGALAATWPIINSMNPATDVLALASIEVDLAPIASGQRITITWRGQPVFIDHRTQEQIADAGIGNDADLKDPALDSDRALRPEWLIVVGVCTHLGGIDTLSRWPERRGTATVGV